MNRALAVTALFALFMLQACGGGGNTPTAPQTPPPVAAPTPAPTPTPTPVPVATPTPPPVTQPPSTQPPAPAPTPRPPTPEPTPAPSGATCNGGAVPNNASCGRPTAGCNDNTWSCSQNRSGTCSTHGGVRCWVCPGPLC